MAKKPVQIADARVASEDRTPITVEFDADEYAQLCTIAEARGITLQALLDEIIDLELRRLRQEERARH